jgi:uncharacterized protein YbaP (TraB family)
MRFRRFSQVATGFFALFLVAPAPAQAPAARPAMWKIVGKGTTIYLFGTMHLLPKGEAWRTPAIDSALASAAEIVLEVPNIDEPNAAAQTIVKLGMAEGLPPLVERVPPEKRAALAAMIAESGVPAAALDRFRTWAAGLILSGVVFRRLGLDPSSGVELSITGPAKAAGKKVEGLETIDEQLGFFNHLSEPAQRAFLAGVLDSPDETRKQFNAMLAAWSKGDVDGIARTFDDETTLSPELRDVLMAKRNAKWADWLKNRLGQPGTLFVAVGAGHLAGKDSVEDMLAARGVTVTRVE